MKKNQDKTKGVWLLNGNIMDVEQDLIAFFTRDGFDISRSAVESGCIKITGTNQVQMSRFFFKFKQPEIVICSLQQENFKQTRLELTYEFSQKFIHIARIIMIFSMAMTFAGFYFALAGMQILFPLLIPFIFIGFGVFMCTVFRIMIRNHDTLLFNELKQYGYAPKILTTLIFAKQEIRFIIFAVSLLTIFALPLAFVKFNGISVGIVIALLGGWFVLLNFLFKSELRVARSPHSVVAVFFAFTFAFYGFIPILLLIPPVNANSSILLKLSLLTAVVLLITTKIVMLNLLTAVYFLRENPQQIKARESQSLNFTVSVAALWIFVSAISFLSIIFSVALLEFCLFGRSYLFPENFASNVIHNAAGVLYPRTRYFHLENQVIPYVKIWGLLYLLPVIAIAGFIVYSNLKQLARYVKLLLTFKNSDDSMVKDASEIAGRISQDSKIIKPYLRVIEAANINAYCILPLIPGIPNIIVLTSSCKTLNKELLEALIAHEMGHLKARHSFVFSVLNFASRWTFLGEGFASLLAKSSKTMELEADEFAVLWLERNIPQGRAALLELLKILEKQRIKMSMSKFPRKELDAFPAFTLGSNAEQLINESVNYSEKKFLEKRLFDFKMLSFFIFHGWISTYIHVPYDARIKYIQELSIRG